MKKLFVLLWILSECGGGLFLGVVKGWVLKWVFCASLGSNFSHLREGLWLRIHQCLKCDIFLHGTACGLEAGRWSVCCITSAPGTSVPWEMCVGAVWGGILKIESVFLTPNQILGVAAGVESVEQVSWSGYSNTQLFGSDSQQAWLAYKGHGRVFPARESRTLSCPLSLLPSAVVDPIHVGCLCWAGTATCDIFFLLLSSW